MANEIGEAGVSLVERLRGVPQGQRIWFATMWNEAGEAIGHKNIPFGHLAHEAADSIERLVAQQKFNFDQKNIARDRAEQLSRDLTDANKEIARKNEMLTEQRKDLAMQSAKEWHEQAHRADVNEAKFYGQMKRAEQAEAKCAEYEVALGGPKYRPAEPTKAVASEQIINVSASQFAAMCDDLMSDHRIGKAVPAEPPKGKTHVVEPAFVKAERHVFVGGAEPTWVTEARIKWNKEADDIKKAGEATEMPAEPLVHSVVHLECGATDSKTTARHYVLEEDYTRLRRHAEALDWELRKIDSLLARRPAIDHLPNRYDKIAHALETAALAAETGSKQ